MCKQKNIWTIKLFALIYCVGYILFLCAVTREMSIWVCININKLINRTSCSGTGIEVKVSVSKNYERYPAPSLWPPQNFNQPTIPHLQRTPNHWLLKTSLQWLLNIQPISNLGKPLSTMTTREPPEHAMQVTPDSSWTGAFNKFLPHWGTQCEG